LGSHGAELGITLTDDRGICELAARYGRPRRATDVLSFSLLEGEGADFRGPLLGDLVISIETAERQARRRGRSLDLELCELVIHGVLHLLGMDHRSKAERRAMRGLEAQLRFTLEQAESA
jgi:probable rRNA maturation factor